ncbi:XLF domain containing protein [Hyaloscypha variabilis]
MAWRALPLSASAGAQLPALFISEAFTPSSYTIQLTDLTHIWRESLDRRAIVRRSRQEGTSIDPSDGTDQLQIFLNKLKLGLAGGKDTALALTIAAGPDRPSLVLNIIVKLPGGLAPLQWPIQLDAAPQSLMTSHFTVPLLKAQHASTQDFASLTEVVKEKDHVIQKLLDKLEGQGTELGQIFPQAAGRAGRKVDRKMAEERVKGLGPFDLAAWRRSTHHETSRDIAGLVGEVFAGDNAASSRADSDAPTEEESDIWWESIKGITINLATGKISTNGLSTTRKTPPRPKPVLRKEDTIEDDDAFQVQATPPHLVQSPKRVASKPVIDNSTDDDDDLDVPTQHSKIPDSFPVSPPQAVPSPKRPKKIGAIGAKKAALKLDTPDEESTVDEASSLHRLSADGSTASETPPPPPPPSEPVIRPRKKLGRIGGKKEPPPPEPEPEPERDISPPPARTTPAAQAPQPKKGKLGQIGGKKRRAETPPPAEEEDAQPETSKTATTPKRKLGVIGNRHQSPAAKKENSPLIAEESRGRASAKPEREKTPPPRETSEERADKKRLQLKRELEEKAKAPVKKKKKF